ncbi:hypothetical protein M406DRAFT_355449 [Cryphonectria parasitica EP155]|uniref:Uncharacterized protein n=1 Tax=Cryphonectria parasitica (strain ATCC 38755 / EP155) TaxID=660469 RepID=A0A9P4Y635_CRYP1|nr:uncharacterized protein M406DRAFT_355449 [Cryphonectria parasitica EP155]KAF3767052.1 hypothetical protein M406DRAFT_355449 [Cryphonectria parasitica EP155]
MESLRIASSLGCKHSTNCSAALGVSAFRSLENQYGDFCRKILLHRRQEIGESLSSAIIFSLILFLFLCLYTMTMNRVGFNVIFTFGECERIPDDDVRKRKRGCI